MESLEGAQEPLIFRSEIRLALTSSAVITTAWLHARLRIPRPSSLPLAS